MNDNNFNWILSEPEEVLDYKIVQGLPTAVEKKVKILLTQDWQPYGKMYKMKAPGENTDIVVQCMVLYKERPFC